MNRYLVFQIYGPMAAWGDVAVGESRVSSTIPGRSALLGMIAAALGIKRTDEDRLSALSSSVRFGVLVMSSGHFLRDYHTAQVPPTSALKRRPSRTRRDELAVPKDDLGTILSARDYRTDASYRVAIEQTEPDTVTLETIQQAVRKPVFPLYLGRKACPPALPLHPQIIEQSDLLSAFRKASFTGTDELLGGRTGGSWPQGLHQPPYTLCWEEGMRSGIEPLKSVTRRDHPRSRLRWQFDERIECQAMIENLEEAACS